MIENRWTKVWGEDSIPENRNKAKRKSKGFRSGKEPWETMFWIRIHIQISQMEPDPEGHKYGNIQIREKKNKKSASFERRSKFYNRNKCTIFLINVTLTGKRNTDILQ